MNSLGHPSLDAPRRYPYGKGSFLVGLMLLAGCEGPPGSSCSVATNADGSSTITCDDGTTATVMSGTDGDSCDLTTNTDGSKTITCPGSDPITVKDGADGEPCTTVADTAAGTVTISCPGVSDVTVSDGAVGADASCTVTTSATGVTTIECNDGSSIIVPIPNDITLDPYLEANEEMPGLNIDILDITGGTGAGGNFKAGDFVKVHFDLLTSDGVHVPIEQIDSTAIWFAGPTTDYQHIIPATTKSLSDVKTASVHNADGTYTYTFATAIPATFPGPLNNGANFTDDGLTGNLTDGTYTVSFAASKNYWVNGTKYLDVANIQDDILFGAATSKVVAPQVVADTNCDTCHTSIRGHGGRYRSVDLCVTCHTAGSEDKDANTKETVEFKVMIHRMHNAPHLPSVQGVSTAADGSRVYGIGKPFMLEGEDFTGIVYPAFPNFNVAMPKDAGYSTLSPVIAAGDTTSPRTKEDNIRKGVTACNDCHGDPDGAAGPFVAPAQGTNAYTGDVRACQSCHDDLDYTKPYVANNGSSTGTMPADMVTGCTTCHSVSNIQNVYHPHPFTDATINPDNTVTITALTGGTGGALNKFIAGDSPSVTFKVRNPADSADVALNTFDSFSLALTGPTQARQVVMPGTLTASPYDFAGRLVAVDTKDKGSMFKAWPAGTTTSATLQLTMGASGAYTFTSTAGGVTTPNGSGTLPGASVFKSGTSFASFTIDPTQAPGNFTLTFSADGKTVAATGAVIGSAVLPNHTNAMVRFKSNDGKVAFNITTPNCAAIAPATTIVWPCAASQGNDAASIINFALIKGSVNQVIVPVMMGIKSTGFAANDRFYYDYAAPAATYTTKIPMDLQNETLGLGNGLAAQVLTAANTPVWYGRQTVTELSPATVPVSTVLAQATPTFQKYLYVPLASGIAADWVLIDALGTNPEFTKISTAPTATGGYAVLGWPLRYPHAAGATVQKFTGVTRLEGVDYTLVSATGTITTITPVLATNSLVLSYRTDGKFGYKLKPGGTAQNVYFTPLQDPAGLNDSDGDWRGKPVIDGTYTVGVWGYKNVDYSKGASVNNEVQTYRGTTKSSLMDFLYGTSATTLGTAAITPYSKISSPAACNTCHNDITFHGGGRRGADTCLMCHATPGPTVNFRTLAHEFHAEAFPVLPNGSASCDKCHGTNTTYADPVSRAYPDATKQINPLHDYLLPCAGCHEGDPAAAAHMELNLTETGAEACAVCHAPGREYSVTAVHRTW